MMPSGRRLRPFESSIKKIIFVTDSLCSGGAERVMSILANEFSRIGYDVTIISKLHEPSFYELDERVKFIHPKTKIDYKNKISGCITRVKLYKDICKYLKKEKPDVVIPFSTTTNGFLVIICKILGLQVVACEHNNYKLNITSFPIWFIKRWVYPFADILTVLTGRDKNEYYNKFIKNVVVMPNPLPFEPRDVENFSFQREKTILAVGSVARWEHKGFDNLLNNFALIAPSYPEWQLQIAGKGDPTYLLGMINELNLMGRVEFLGEVNDVQRLMQESSIFVLPSRWEGLPMVLIEAMSQGMPCVAFDCFTGPRDIITHGVDGLLVEDQDNEQFVAKIFELIEDENLRLKLGINAIETSKKYAPEKIVSLWVKVFDTISSHS